MSNCRCSDIENCERDIQTLTDEKNILPGCRVQLLGISKDLGCLGNDSWKAFDGANIQELTAAIRALDNDMESVWETIRSKIDARISELESEKSDMEEEDKDYHSKEETDENPSTQSNGTTDGEESSS